MLDISIMYLLVPSLRRVPDLPVCLVLPLVRARRGLLVVPSYQVVHRGLWVLGIPELRADLLDRVNHGGRVVPKNRAGKSIIQ